MTAVECVDTFRINQVGKHIKPKQDLSDTVIYLHPISTQTLMRKYFRYSFNKTVDFECSGKPFTVSPNLKTAKLMGSEDGG